MIKMHLYEAGDGINIADGMLRKIKRYINKLAYPKMGDILIFHQVTSNMSVLQGNRQYEVTPEFLEKTILEYKSKGYEFIAMDDLYL